jgi:hypothetical protein
MDFEPKMCWVVESIAAMRYHDNEAPFTMVPAQHGIELPRPKHKALCKTTADGNHWSVAATVWPRSAAINRNRGRNDRIRNRD